MSGWRQSGPGCGQCFALWNKLHLQPVMSVMYWLNEYMTRFNWSQLWFEVYSPPLTATGSYLVLHTFPTHCGLSFTETGDKPYSCTNVRLIPNFICIPVFDAYMKLSGYEIEESIKRETSGNLKDLLLAVGMCSRWLPEVILLSLAPPKRKALFQSW